MFETKSIVFTGNFIEFMKNNFGKKGKKIKFQMKPDLDIDEGRITF